MNLSGIVKSIERLPYEALLEIENSSVEGISSISVRSTKENVLFDFSTGDNIHLLVSVWLATVTEVSEVTKQTYISQPENKNGLFGCGEVVKLKSDGELEVLINGIKIRLDIENSPRINFGNFITFHGELTTEI